MIVPLLVDIADILPDGPIFAIDLKLWQIYNQTTARLVDKLGALWLRRGFFLKGVAVQNNPAKYGAPKKCDAHTELRQRISRDAVTLSQSRTPGTVQGAAVGRG